MAPRKWTCSGVELVFVPWWFVPWWTERLNSGHLGGYAHARALNVDEWLSRKCFPRNIIPTMIIFNFNTCYYMKSIGWIVNDFLRFWKWILLTLSEIFLKIENELYSWVLNSTFMQCMFVASVLQKLCREVTEDFTQGISMGLSLGSKDKRRTWMSVYECLCICVLQIVVRNSQVWQVFHDKLTSIIAKSIQSASSLQYWDSLNRDMKYNPVFKKLNHAWWKLI